MTTAETNLCFLTIGDASALLQRRELSPVDLTRAFLDRIEATDGQLHSFITVLKDAALADARAAESEIIGGNYKGPLHGIPFALKDLYDTAGVRTTAGSKVDIDRVPAELGHSHLERDQGTQARLLEVQEHGFALQRG